MKKLYAVFIITLLILSIIIVGVACSKQNDTRSNLSVNDVDSFAIKDYVDPETGVHYLLYEDGDAGGICPRYNADGSIMVVVSDTDR